MIVKQMDSHRDCHRDSQVDSANDVLARAGRRAEEQMAFYLRRVFGEKKDIFVFNDLRLVRLVNGVEDVGQIDHLVMHRAGLIIIESKAVHDRVCVNERGEWSRTYRGRHQGMPSPIEQAKRQAEFLGWFLNDHAPKITGKLFGLVQAYFGMLSIDVIVAVSDSGIIERPKSLPLPEVCKADQVPVRVEELLALQRRETGLIAPLSALAAKRGRDLSRAEMENLTAFLPAQHRPAKAMAAKSLEVPSESVSSAPSAPPIRASSPSRVASSIPAVSDTTAAEGSAPAAVASASAMEEKCAVCDVALSPKVAQFCRDNEKRFGGRMLCFTHQRRGLAASAPNGINPVV